MIDVWETLESAFPAIIGALRTAEKDLTEHPVQQVEGWGRLMDFLLFEGQAINGEIVTENLHRRAYMNPVAMNTHYRLLAEEGYATEEKGLFMITDKGRDAYLDFFAQRAKAYEPVQLLPEVDFTVFINFMKKGYETAKTTDQPYHKPGMIGFHFYTNIGGGQPGTLLGWINLFELYRDDVHADVWKKAGFTGIQIESLSNIWRDDAHNAGELAEKLAFRGYVEADYQQALDELVAKELLAVDDNHYTLTEKGLAQREQIENDTNQIYDEFCSETYSEQEVAEFARVISVINAE